VGRIQVKALYVPVASRVKAFVVLKERTTCDAMSLIRFCKESLACFKAPKFVEFVLTLPRTGLRKIDRARLEEIVKSRED